MKPDLDDIRGRVDRSLGGISTPCMEGDNLAIVLCSYFEQHEGEEHETGWTAAAIAAQDEVLKAIRDHYRQSYGAKAAECERILVDLAWIQDIADKNYEQDKKLSSKSARMC